MSVAIQDIKTVDLKDHPRVREAVEAMKRWKNETEPEMAALTARAEVIQSEHEAHWVRIFQACKDEGLIAQDADYDNYSIVHKGEQGLLQLKLRENSFKAFAQKILHGLMSEKEKALAQFEDDGGKVVIN